jgi:ABC-type antimicrobial peptide transport system permease subunit
MNTLLKDYNSRILVRGTGPAVVLVPGMDGTGELFYRQVPLLQKSHTVATYALRDDATSMEALADDLERPRSNARLLGLFALSAMLLASVGLYGLVTQIVSARRQEIGIRMALGADARRIVSSVLAGAGRLVAAGVLCGVVLTLAVQPVLKSLLFGVGPLDGLSIAVAALVLVAVSALAALVPARSAASIDPIETLRSE